MKYRYLLKNVRRYIKRFWNQYIREIILTGIFFSFLNLLNVFSDIFEQVAVILNGKLGMGLAINPITMAIGIIRVVLWIMLAVFAVYMVFFYKNYLASQRILYKNNLQSRYLQVPDKDYILIEFFLIRFSLLVPSMLLGTIAGKVLAYLIYKQIKKSFWLFENTIIRLDINQILGQIVVSLIVVIVLYLWERSQFVKLVNSPSERFI